jgi:succinate dehydrogenase/fumarate reductase flavoprotein subunit
LIAGLLLACAERGIEIRTGVRARRLVRAGDRVTGVAGETEAGVVTFGARRGIVLASGSFQWNAQMTARHIAGPAPHPFTPPSNEGDGIVMAMELGAATALMDETLWGPTIRVPGDEIDGRELYRPFTVESVRPYSLVVDRHGRRCYNESFWPGWARLTPPSSCIGARRFTRRCTGSATPSTAIATAWAPSRPAMRLPSG